jgi:outer membrane protein
LGIYTLVIFHFAIIMKKVLFFALTLLLTAGLLPVWGETKIGYVNMETVFNEYYKTVNENIGFESKRKSMIDGFALLRDEFEKSQEEYRKTRTDAENELLAPEKREEAKNKMTLLEQRLEQKQVELYKFRQQSMAQIESRQQAVMEELIKELRAQVDKFAKDNGYTIIFEVSGKNMNRMPTVLVYPHEDEITDQLVKIVNAGHEQEKAAADQKLKEVREKSAAAMKAAAAASQN